MARQWQCCGWYFLDPLADGPVSICFVDQFQALIQYSDSISAQTAKVVRPTTFYRADQATCLSAAR